MTKENTNNEMINDMIYPNLNIKRGSWTHLYIEVLKRFKSLFWV